jgi:hypothetical protein
MAVTYAFSYMLLSLSLLSERIVWRWKEEGGEDRYYPYPRGQQQLAHGHEVESKERNRKWREDKKVYRTVLDNVGKSMAVPRGYCRNQPQLPLFPRLKSNWGSISETKTVPA